MKTRYILSLMLLALLLNSCSVTTMFKSSEKSMGRQAESNGNTVALVNKPILADLTVSMTRQSIIFTTTNLELNNSSMDIQSAGTTNMVQGGELNYLHVTIWLIRFTLLMCKVNLIHRWLIFRLNCLLFRPNILNFLNQIVYRKV